MMWNFMGKNQKELSGVLWKNVFLKMLQNSQENTCARVSFLIKLRAAPFLQNTSRRLLLKNKKDWWSRDLAFQANGERSEAKLIGHSCYGGCPTYFLTTETILSFSCSMKVLSCKTLGKIIYITRPDTSIFLACLMGINNLLQYTLFLLKSISLEQRQQRWQLLLS